jgi:phosphoglycolate phosphatase
MSAKNILFLWDIDGTLITVGGAGERSLIYAIKDHFGIDGDLKDIDYSGRTDRMISHMLHDYYGVEKTDESQRGFLDSYIFHLEKEMKHTRMRIIDGILEILEAIKAHPLCFQGLLTGNLKKGADIKLLHFNLLHYFPFGGFSDFSVHRNELAAFALEEACKNTGIEFSKENTYVIGDTPHDITCGKAIGAKTIAMATGHFTTDQLKPHQPDVLLDRFPDAQEFMKLTNAD